VVRPHSAAAGTDRTVDCSVPAGVLIDANADSCDGAMPVALVTAAAGALVTVVAVPLVTVVAGPLVTAVDGALVIVAAFGVCWTCQVCRG